jgi:hypothetical protein
MDNKYFVEIYTNETFNSKIKSMLIVFYNRSRVAFLEQAIDVEDFIEEMWQSLFESKKYKPEMPLCYEIIRCNAIDYVRKICKKHNKIKIVSLDSYNKNSGLGGIFNVINVDHEFVRHEACV